MYVFVYVYICQSICMFVEVSMCSWNFSNSIVAATSASDYIIMSVHCPFKVGIYWISIF